MKLKNLASKSKTSLNILHPVTGEDTGVIIDGYTPDSSEWEQKRKSIISTDGKTTIIIEKNRQKLEIDNDMADKNQELQIAVITDIRGIDGWEYSEKSKNSLLTDPQYTWILEQWKTHLDDRSNFF